MSQHHSPTTALVATSRALIAAQRELIPLLEKRAELANQLFELEGSISLAKDKVAALKEAREVLNFYVYADDEDELSDAADAVLEGPFGC